MKKLSKLNKTIKLSIVTLNYNSAGLVTDLVTSILKSKNIDFGIKIIVVDNASPDNSLVRLRQFKDITLVASPVNKGFANGNNLGVKHVQGEYVWFLNPDTTVEPDTIAYMISYMDSHPQAGLATPKLILTNGSFDKNCHRGFPNIWNSFCHFVGLDKIFPTSRLFAGYYLGHLGSDVEAEVDVIGGSSALIRRKLGEQIGWWDESYFMYGEDIEFAFEVKQAGYKVMFVPEVIVHHHHGATSGLKKTSQNVTTADKGVRLRSALATTQAMRIFYQKHYAAHRPMIVNWLVYLGIWLLEIIRRIRLTA